MDAILQWIPVDLIQSVGGSLIQAQIAHYTIAFVVAWKIVKRDMKKEISTNFSKLEEAILKVGESMHGVSQDLTKHSRRLDTLENIVIELKNSFIKKITPGG